MEKKAELFIKKNAEIVTPSNPPPPRFGHTVNLVSKTTIIIFGGAISSPGNYTMTADLYLYNMTINSWKKLERMLYNFKLKLERTVYFHMREQHMPQQL
ncbi:MAG: hypothetical protein RIR51_686 [Bacteroidota bacterium]